ncbi:zinc finger MYND domain-containing protein 11 isoform X2 [Frankliniella occidentalis]|uniref:Zinc finger MYND domain-containing protein 11 isoform X2 n=1 Tax=Frankliniella occidentalis TaxID=133901 RepID=A0A9C6U337_FRAOC|nr:zinc finger MYND domain-containing protein 11 isoform X2 [Frankliniella occidentalis]
MCCTTDCAASTVRVEIMNKKLFLAMSRRRVSSPQTTQQLWDAIRITSYQRQIPDVNRISRYMSRIHGVSEDEVRRQLSYCVRDGLIRLVKRLGYKGTKIGVEQESYRLPKPKSMVRDDHDWYCFICHSGGDVICCTSCHRVYHLACIEKEELPEEDVKNKFVCNVCKMCEGVEENFKIKKSQLNRLLTFTCARLKEKLPVTIMDRTVPSNSSYISDRTSSVTSHQRRASGAASDSNIKWVTDDADAAWRIRNLIYCPMDLQTMEKKALKNKYKSLAQFRADAQTIVHNVVIYHGDGTKTRLKRDAPWVHSPLADMARQMFRDCNYDLQEIRQCRDCYRMSNEKLDRHWFCQPCRPPHQLVYAKQKGFPYWPAKVIKVDDKDVHDVRFFGGHHQRALIEKAFIRQISVNIHSLQVKKTSSWNKACEELKRHQSLLDEMRRSTNDFTKFESSEDEVEDEEDSEDEDSKLEKENIEDEDEEDEEDEEEAEADQEHDTDDGEEERISKDLPKTESVSEPPAATEESLTIPSPKKRGRKRKHKETEEIDTEEDACITSTSVKRKSKKDGTSQEDTVTSSCEEPVNRSFATQTNKKAPITPTVSSKEIAKAVKEALEKQKCEFDAERAELEEKREQAVANAVRSYEQDLGRMQTEHTEVIADLEEKHRAAISEVKKKQWCYNCEQEAIYHCCWNTAYCSTECQQTHWQKEHKKVCRRKR